ncbi:MAG: disulfide bond formation protein DsbA, partial [Actinobacteria bacterium]
RRVVMDAFEEGQRSGITGTPTFVINSQTLVGAQPMEVFEEAIEGAAREAQGG